MAPILGYWDSRGQAEPIRYLLHYAGVKFEDKRYTVEEDWYKDKFELELDFPNLPYYLDGKVKLSQSLAILRHLGRKHKLAGSNEEEQMRIDLAEQQINDLRYNFVVAAFCPESDFKEKKAELLKNIPAQLKLLSSFVGENKWFTGENVTYVDFLAYETLDYYWLLIPSMMKGFPNLKSFVERFEKLRAIKNYMKSDVYKRWPIYPPFANFGGTGEEPKRE